jgi:hypothetical protein
MPSALRRSATSENERWASSRKTRPHDCGLLRHGLERRRVDDPVAERVVPAVASVLEGASHHGLRAFRVNVALKRRGADEHLEHEDPDRRVVLGVGQVAGQDCDVAAPEPPTPRALRLRCHSHRQRKELT